MTSIGQPTIYGSILPPSFTKLNIKQLSLEAKFRLRFLEHYLKQSALHSHHHKPNATLTCQLFGITRSLLYKWLKRF
jgi:transposase-like protein